VPRIALRRARQPGAIPFTSLRLSPGIGSGTDVALCAAGIGHLRSFDAARTDEPPGSSPRKRKQDQRSFPPMESQVSRAERIELVGARIDEVELLRAL